MKASSDFVPQRAVNELHVSSKSKMDEWSPTVQCHPGIFPQTCYRTIECCRCFRVIEPFQPIAEEILVRKISYLWGVLIADTPHCSNDTLEASKLEASGQMHSFPWQALDACCSITDRQESESCGVESFGGDLVELEIAVVQCKATFHGKCVVLVLQSMTGKVNPRGCLQRCRNAINSSFRSI